MTTILGLIYKNKFFYHLSLIMKTFIAIFLILILSSEIKSKIGIIHLTDKKINNKIQELRNNKVDTIVCYYINCIGSRLRLASDSCVAYDIKYLLWSDHGNHYIQRFDECKEYQSATASLLSFGLLKWHYSEIQRGGIKYPEYKIRVNGKLGIYHSFIDHSCHNIFEIHTNNKIVKKDIDDYALETKYDEEKHLNRNFYLNKKSILNKLKLAIEHDVDMYNKNH